MKLFFTTMISVCLAAMQVHAQPGRPDKSFGNEGKALDTSIWALCESMAIQTDGKILTGGQTDTNDDNLYGGLLVCRFNTDGSPDQDFGKNGKFIITQIPGAIPSSAKVIAVQPDGKIIVCGYFITDNTPSSSPGLLRLQTDGRIDSSFGTNGFVVTRLSSWSDLISGMVLQPDGKIIIAGKQGIYEDEYGADYLLRYLPDGTLDMEFGNKGVVLTSYPTSVTLGAVALTADGKILTSGRYGITTEMYQVARYNTDGSLDKAFGTNGFGRFAAQPNDRSASTVNAMTVQPDGKIILCGTATSYDLSLVRFSADGTIDPDFGDLKGYTMLRRDIGGVVGKSVFYTPEDKKILVSSWFYYDAGHQVAALRYDNDGILDSSYGENGIASGGFSKNKYGTDFTSGKGILQADGKMVVSGSFLQNNGDTYNVALFRFTGDENKKQIITTRIKRWLQHHGITWQTDNNVRYYNVQRSTDGGVSFQPAARIYNNHQLTFTYEDEGVNAGTNTCYRIASIAKDGTRSYSNSVFVNNTAEVKVFPNPVRANLQLYGLSTTGNSHISILDLHGNVRSNSVSGGNSYSLNTSFLAPGNYVLKIQNNNTVTTQSFIKQ